MSAIDVAALVADGHLDLDEVFPSDVWETGEIVTSFVACCFGDFGDEPGEVDVRLASATAYGITVYRWSEPESGETGPIHLTEQAARDGAEDYAEDEDESNMAAEASARADARRAEEAAAEERLFAADAEAEDG